MEKLRHIAAIWRNRTDPSCAKVGMEVFWFSVLVWMAFAVVASFALGTYFYFFSVSNVPDALVPIGTPDTLKRDFLKETIGLYETERAGFQELLDNPMVFPDPSVPKK